MNIIVWNCRGASKPYFLKHVSALVHNHNPVIMVVMETRIGGERTKQITDRMPFDEAHHMETIGYAGGLWILWDSNRVEVTPLLSTKQEIHAVVKVHNSNSSWMFTAVYASPRTAERHILWNNLAKVYDLHNMP